MIDRESREMMVADAEVRLTRLVGSKSESLGESGFEGRARRYNGSWKTGLGQETAVEVRFRKEKRRARSKSETICCQGKHKAREEVW